MISPTLRATPRSTNEGLELLEKQRDGVFLISFIRRHVHRFHSIKSVNKLRERVQILQLQARNGPTLLSRWRTRRAARLGALFSQIQLRHCGRKSQAAHRGDQFVGNPSQLSNALIRMQARVLQTPVFPS